MNAVSRKALTEYSRTDAASVVEGASPHKLILMLYDGAIQAIAKAKFAMHNKDVAAKCKSITHAYAIIQEGLQLSLDVKAGGELASNMNDLYDYMCNRLLDANIKNEIEALDEVSRLLGELRAGWVAIGEKQGQPEQTKVSDAIPIQRAATVSYGAA